MRRLLAIVLAVALLTAGCSRGTTASPTVRVSGAAGSAPSLSFDTPLAVAKTTSSVVWAGKGAELVEGKPVLIDYWLENAATGALVTETYSTSPKAYLMTQESLGTDLFTALRGQRVGARIVQESPAPASGPTDFPTVIVMDVLGTRAVGVAVAPRAGLPTITLNGDGAPVPPATSTAPPTDLTVQTLIKGAGAQVPQDAQVTVQYSESDWTTGTVVDSTWTKGLPVSFSLKGLEAWSQALVEQTVGSQVIVVVPPSFGLGGPAGSALEKSTLVFVVDILAASEPVAAPSSDTTSSPTISPNASPTS